MLGFLSGLAFIILCGSSAAYNNRGRSPEKLEDVVVKAPPQNTLPQPETQTIGDIEILFGRTDKGDEFTVQALGIEPNAQVSVELRNKEQVLTTKTVSADDMGSISVRLGPLSETLSLERIEVIVSSGAVEKRTIYVLPLNVASENTLTEQFSPSSQSPTSYQPPTPTPSPSTSPSPLPPTNTATPVPTLTWTPSPTCSTTIRI